MTVPSTTVLYTFSLQQVQVAPWLGVGTYGTAFELASAKTLSVSQDLITDKAYGNSQVSDLESMPIGNTAQLDTAGFDQNLLKVFQNSTPSTSGSDTIQDTTNALMPYFGVIAQALVNSGDILLYFPKCKITKSWTYKLDFGKIIVPQFSFEAIQELAPWAFMLRSYSRPNGGVITFPPTV